MIDAHSFLWFSYRQSQNENGNWREKLARWLETNSATLPQHLRELREEFVRRFPKENVENLTLEEYALGTGNKDSFCNWVEFKTKAFAAMGGFSSKFGVWKSGEQWKFNQTFKNPEDALAKIKDGLIRLVQVAEENRFDELEKVDLTEFGKERNGLRAKTLYLYFPDELLPMVNKEHIAGGSYQVSEGSNISLSGSGTDVDGTALSFTWDLDNDGTFETTRQSPTFYAAGIDGPTSRTVKLKVTDAAGLSAVDMATVNVLNVAPTLNSITGPVAPQPVSTTINITLNYTDPAFALEQYTATINWGDGTINNSLSHVYTSAGVYRIRATVSDDDGVSNEAVYEYVVVYDPNGGFVTGGGWIMSPAGAYVPNPSLTGKATFGFVSKYQRGATVPSGNTEFQFHAADFRFKSDSYEWLVIAGAKAQYKGTGSVNGVPVIRLS